MHYSQLYPIFNSNKKSALVNRIKFSLDLSYYLISDLNFNSEHSRRAAIKSAKSLEI